jgi:hypothetical protein
MGAAIAAMTRDALNRIAADIPVTGLHLGISTLTVAGQPRPCPMIILRLGPPYAPPAGAEMTYWWAYARWTLSQDDVDTVVREKMLELRASVATETAAPPGLARPGARPRSRLILPPGSPAGQG